MGFQLSTQSHEARSWREVGKWPFPWVPHLAARLKERNLSPLSGPDLWVASDYSGAHRGSRFSSVAVMIVDAADSIEWHAKRMAVRQQYLADGRRMSFKALNDSNRRAALVPFLDAADSIRGATIVFAIDKRLRNFADFKGFYEGLKERGIVLGEWKADSFEHMIAVTHTISVLLGTITRQGQSVTWISDADECFATDVHKRDCAKMIGIFSGFYVEHTMGTLAVGTTELDEGDRLEEDLTAIPDLAAGAVGELFNSMAQEFGKVPGIASYLPRQLSRKSDLITSWFFAPNAWHQKIACVAQSASGGRAQIGALWEDHSLIDVSVVLPTD